MEEILAHVLTLQRHHCETWRDRHELYWLTQLLKEVAELGNALVGEHEHDPSYELTEIASICLNWLDMRAKQAKHKPQGAAHFPRGDSDEHFCYPDSRQTHKGGGQRD